MDFLELITFYLLKKKTVIGKKIVKIKTILVKTKKVENKDNSKKILILIWSEILSFTLKVICFM